MNLPIGHVYNGMFGNRPDFYFFRLGFWPGDESDVAKKTHGNILYFIVLVECILLEISVICSVSVAFFIQLIDCFYLVQPLV